MDIVMKNQEECNDDYTRQRLRCLDFGININAQDRRGLTQLHKELLSGIHRSGKSKYAFKTTQLLIEHGADINLCSKDGTSPLQEAFLSGNLDAVELFIPEEARPLKMKKGDNIKRCRHLMNFFLDQGTNLNNSISNYSTLLHFAALHKDNEGFNFILENSSYDLNAFNSKGTTLLHVIVTHGTSEMVESLMDHGANSILRIQSGQGENIRNKIVGFTPLYLAVAEGKFDIVKMLVKKGADVNEPSPLGSPLHIACDTFYSSDDTEKLKIVKFLIERGANIHASNANKKTPLIMAIDNQFNKMIEVLLLEGVNFEIKYPLKRSVIHHLAKSKHYHTMKLFLEKGFDPNSRDVYHDTPLTYGVKWSPEGTFKDIATLLVEYGADINAANKSGDTALHIAAGKNNIHLIRCLLKLKADVNVCNNRKETPFDLSLVYNSHFFRSERKHKINPAIIETIECLCAYTVLSLFKGANNSVRIDLIEKLPLINKFYKECEKQIKLMQTEEVCSSSSICYLDFLVLDIQKIIFFLRNENVLDVLKTRAYEKKFPVYASLLKEFIEMGETLRDLIERASLLLKKITKLNLPYFINDMIFSSLSLNDLRNFEEAFISSSSGFT